MPTTWCRSESSTYCRPLPRTNKPSEWSASSTWSADVDFPIDTNPAPSLGLSGAEAPPTLPGGKLSDIGLKSRLRARLPRPTGEGHRWRIAEHFHMVRDLCLDRRPETKFGCGFDIG